MISIMALVLVISICFLSAEGGGTVGSIFENGACRPIPDGKEC